MARGPEPRVATLGGEPFVCLACRGAYFFELDGLMQSRGGWDTRPSVELICQRCGYVHRFVKGATTETPIEVWTMGYPRR